MRSFNIEIEDVLSISSDLSDSVNCDSTTITPRRYTANTGAIQRNAVDLEKDKSANEIVEEMLSLLTYTLNSQLKRNVTQAEAHEDAKGSSLVDKLAHVKGLVTKVCQSYLDQLDLTSDSYVEAKTQETSFKRRQPKSKSVVLSQEDCIVLCGLLNSPQKNPKTEVAPHVSKLQTQYANICNKHLNSQVQLRKKEDEAEHLTDINMQLRSSCKMMQQQIKSLERQLVDSMEEAYRLEENYQRTMDELSTFKAYNLTETNEDCLTTRLKS